MPSSRPQSERGGFCVTVYRSSASALLRLRGGHGPVPLAPHSFVSGLVFVGRINISLSPKSSETLVAAAKSSSAPHCVGVVVLQRYDLRQRASQVQSEEGWEGRGLWGAADVIG